MRHRVAVRGAGRVQLPAYGLTDAEHQVEKELRALWPEAAVEVTGVERVDEGSRIVEEFRVSYRVRCVLEVEASGAGDAGKAALRLLRDRFAGTRFERIAWEPVQASPRLSE